MIAVLVYLLTGASVHARRIADEMLPRAEAMSLATRLQSGQISYDSFWISRSKNSREPAFIYSMKMRI
ncbi:MAG: hypothetical protein R2912_09015 [Eubacteriales bacterium]